MNIGLIGNGENHTKYIRNLVEGLIVRDENTKLNPIDLSISIEDLEDMMLVMDNKPETNKNGYLQGTRMNKLLGKRN